MANIRYGAGGVPYHVQEDDIKITKVEVKPEKKEEPKKKKKKVIQEIMGDDLNEEKETLDEII
jgi:hypothetical protein|tara:strand:+ start:208 stop:396 length:189 start_codon:yes stop_codon:yes gene_type:complete